MPFVCPGKCEEEKIGKRFLNCVVHIPRALQPQDFCRRREFPRALPSGNLPVVGDVQLNTSLLSAVYVFNTGAHGYMYFKLSF